MFYQVVILLCYVFVAFAQECRLVPVCDDNGGSEGSVSTFKGAKGSQGVPGKAGPQGPPGLSVKGDRGDPGDCNATLISLMAKLKEIQNQLLPASCLTSSVFGVQRLRSGEEAFCDNGWTVFQRRFDGSVNFDVLWDDYKRGFGNLSGDFWLGLDKIHSLTNKRACKLRVDLWSFNDEQAFAEYRVFAVENESDHYRLHVDGYNSMSTAGDSLLKADRLLTNMQFTTKDRDNDNGDTNCASDVGQGGWWYNNCFYASLNGLWGASHAIPKSIYWHTWKAWNALKATTMKLRCDG